MKKVLATITCVLQIFLFVGCRPLNNTVKNEPKESVSNVNTTSVDNESAQRKAKEADIQKYNAYIDLNNFMTGRMTTVINSYYDRVKNQEELVLKNKDFFCNSISDSDKKKLDKALEFADKEPKFDNIDASIKALYPVMKDLVSTFSEVYNYSEMKTYVDDNYAKAKELNKSIYKLYPQYSQLSENFMNALAAEENTRTQKEMEELKAKEFYIRYYSISVLQRAQNIEAYFDKNNITSVNLLSMDLTGFQEQYDLMLKDIDELNKYSKDAEQQKKENFTSNTYRLEDYTKSVIEMKVAATEILERVKKQNPIAAANKLSSFALENTHGSIENFSNKISATVNSYNLMNK